MTGVQTCALPIYDLADNYSDMKEYTKAEEYYRQSLEMRKRIHGEDSDHPEIAVALNNLDINYSNMKE